MHQKHGTHGLNTELHGKISNKLFTHPMNEFIG